MVKNLFFELLLIEGNFFLGGIHMTSTNSNIKIISPFVEGILGCFDPFGFLNDFTLPLSQNGNSILDDWSAIHQDYNNSIKIINEELNAEKKISGK
jgi:hypothetical protein